MILGVIPARGGSKGVPRKNLHPLVGKPLIAWTIEAAKRSAFLDYYVVATDDAEIAAVARSYGAPIFDESPELAADDGPTIRLLQHITRVLEPDHVVLLQPTSPVRLHGLIDKCIKQFFAAKVDTLATGFISYQYAWGTMPNVPRQQMAGWFYDDGNVQVHRAAHLARGEWIGPTNEPMVIPRYMNLEIDEEADFWAYEGIIAHLLHEYGSLA